MTEPEGLALQQRMYSEHRIEVPIVPWAGQWFLRVSCQAYNTLGEYERLRDVVARLASGPG